MTHDVEAKWRQTLGTQSWEEVDPRQTHKPDHVGPPVDAGEAADDPRQTAVPDVVLPEDDEVVHGVQLGELIGQGGMADVFAAAQVSLQRDVAVKVVRKKSGTRSFVSEARITGALDHPNVLPIHDLVLLDEETPALVMKRVSGESWRQRLDRLRARNEYDLAAELRTLLAVTQAVAFAHAHGVLHLDLKPGNVMVGDFGEVLLMDWGCAVVDDSFRWVEQPTLPRASWVTRPFGTPAYMPPELALGDGESIGRHSDVFLLGAILYDLVAGHPPRRGKGALQIVRQAAAGQMLPLPPDCPDGLSELIRDATAPDPDRRLADARAFEQRLRHWLDTRQSRKVTRAALRVLARLQSGEPDPTAPAGHGDDDEVLFEVIGAFQQARLLWEQNDVALRGEHATRILLAQRALGRGDAGLAEAQAMQLPAHEPQRGKLLDEVQRVREERERQERNTQRLRWGLGLAVIATLLSTAVGLVLVALARDQALANEAKAEERYAEVMRLSDHRAWRELEDREPLLWPAVPANVPAMESWLGSAKGLVAKRADHAAALTALGPPTPAEPVEVRWRRQLLTDLVTALQTLGTEVVPDIEARLERARTLRRRSIDDYAVAWRQVQQAVRDDPRYRGLELQPQLGLVPLGPDPVSGLQEFAHLPSGDVPVRGAGGRIVVEPEHGVVLVLLPGGEATIGASTDPGAAHVDPDAKSIEGPVHRVELDPFFMAKHELTQAQWVRIMGELPAAYPMGRTVGGHTITGAHPIELVRWREATEALRRLGLVLPTEAQWEYAARAGTTTRFWTGDTVASLQGTLNIADRWARDHEGPQSWRYEAALDDGYLTHAPVGRYRANPFGLHDVAGNVWEWCRDRYGSYELPTEPGTGERRVDDLRAPNVFRGGGFRANASHARSADRYSLYANDFRAYDVGLRAARPLDASMGGGRP